MFPMTLKHTLHRDGGRITRIDRIAHETRPPEGGYSRDFWFFVGRVEWDDGEVQESAQIHPWQLCEDDTDDASEINTLCRALNKYLAVHGTWNPGEGTRRNPKGWNAHRAGGKHPEPPYVTRDDAFPRGGLAFWLVTEDEDGVHKAEQLESVTLDDALAEASELLGRPVTRHTPECA
jgi:hypothetical protein